ncbi:MAG: LysM peptidoglycan-binding domain-containing protein [Betaproteobacteria bacterium]|nr:MAG: LysM peptidoglycan-binding domain-containing protein [Betaproteobacteria bacterium]
MTNFPVSAPAAIGRPELGMVWNRGSLLAWLIVSLLIVARVGPAWGQQSRFPVTDDQRQTAEKVATQGVPLSELAPGAPERYTIKKGDTLWAISVLYLKSPWRWPELWGMNRKQIANPHLIYPGQQMVLVKTAEGRAVLMLAGTEGTLLPAAPIAPPPAPVAPAAPPLPMQKLEPRVRDLGDVSAEPIPSIPNRLIEPFLSQPMIVSAEDLAKYPRIVGTPEDRVYLGRGDQAYARGIEDRSLTDFHIFRPARPLFEPDDYKHARPVAYEAYFLGSGRVVRRGEVTTLKITDSRAEIGVQDRLVPIQHEPLITYAPHRPLRPVEGWLISVYGGIGDVGANGIVTLDRGASDGLDIGTVLAINRSGKTLRDITVPGNEFVKLPDERIGQMFVFRVFDHIAYALVMTAIGPIKVGDRFSLPDRSDSASSADPSSSVPVAVAR